jgi:hypothetical protein
MDEENETAPDSVDSNDDSKKKTKKPKVDKAAEIKAQNEVTAAILTPARAPHL